MKTRLTHSTLDALRHDLHEFDDFFTFSIKGASNQIVQASTDREVRRRTVYWKLIAIPHLRSSIFEQEPLEALIDVWAFCEQMANYLESGEGTNSFGEYTSIAALASRELVERIELIAKPVIPEESFEKARTGVKKFARDQPVRGLFARQSTRPVLVEASESQDLRWIADLPLVPFRALTDEHAKAIREFSHVADRFTHFVESVPEVLRWHVELLLYDVEARESVVSALDSLKTVSTSSERYAAFVESIPDKLRFELTAALKGFEKNQEGFRETLADVRTSLASAQRTTATIDTLAQNWTEAAASWEKAVLAADILVQRFTDKPGRPPTDDDRKFDIRDYTKTAKQAEAAATELRTLTNELERLAKSNSAGDLAWQVAWPAVLVIVMFFLALLAYRAATARMSHRSK